MTIRHLKVFVAVCAEGSITKAGEKLFMAQPTISLAISELEKHYGTKLFDRISRRLHLTDAGRRLLPYAQHIALMFDEMEAGSRDWDNSGTLRVGTSITIGNCLLPGLLKAFAAQRPGVTVKVQVDNSEKIAQAVLDNRIDLGLVEGVTHSDLLVAQPFWEDELVLLCGPKHPWAKQPWVTPQELKSQPFLMREKGSGGREILEGALLLQGIELEPLWESISTQAIVQGVIEGLGVAVLPLMLVAGHLSQGTLLARSIEGLSLKRHFAITHHRNKYLSGTAEAFIALCKEGG